MNIPIKEIGNANNPAIIFGVAAIIDILASSLIFGKHQISPQNIPIGFDTLTIVIFSAAIFFYLLKYQTQTKTVAPKPPVFHILVVSITLFLGGKVLGSFLYEGRFLATMNEFLLLSSTDVLIVAIATIIIRSPKSSERILPLLSAAIIIIIVSFRFIFGGSIIGNPNYDAFVLAAFAPLLLTGRIPPILILMLYLISVAGLFFLGSRAAFFSLIATAPLFMIGLVIDKRNIIRTAIAAYFFLIVSVAAISFANYENVIKTLTHDASANARILEHQIIIKNIISDSPIYGFGYASSRLIHISDMQNYYPNFKETIFEKPHSEYLNALSEGGIISLFGLLMFLITVCITLLRAVLVHADKYSLSLFASISSISIMSFAAKAIQLPGVKILITIIFALAIHRITKPFSK